MNISVVIPNYNGENILEANLSRVIEVLKKYTNGKKEIVIVDDASVDKSWEILQEIQKEYSTNDLSISVYRNQYNKGFATTVNTGVGYAKGDIVLLLNTDIIPEDGFIEPLITHFKDEKVFAVGCMDKSIENERVTLRGRGLGKWHKGLFTHKKGDVTKTNTLWVSGGSGAFRRDVWNTLGGLDSIYNPFYWEDIDLSYRAVKSGYTVLFEPNSIVVHEHEKGSIKTQNSRKNITTISYRNQFIFIWKNITEPLFIVEHVLWLPVHIGKAVLRGDTAFFHGVIAALRKLPAILKSRNRAKKLFTLTDTQVIARASST